MSALANLRATFRGLAIVQARADAMVAGESPARGDHPVALKQRPHDDLCALCQVAEAHPDDVSGLCNSCATEMAMDRAEMDRDDCRVGLCCSNNCGGYCEGGLK